MLLSKFVQYYCLHCTNTKNIAYHVTEELIFYADKITVMGNSTNLCVNIHVLQYCQTSSEIRNGSSQKIMRKWQKQVIQEQRFNFNF